MSDIQAQISEMVNKHKVFLFMKGTPQMPQCGFSNSSASILNHLGAEFGSFDVLSDPEVRQGVKEFASWPTIPQLYVNGEFVGGSDIMMQMFESGELGALLNKED